MQPLKPNMLDSVPEGRYQPLHQSMCCMWLPWLQWKGGGGRASSSEQTKKPGMIVCPECQTKQSKNDPESKSTSFTCDRGYCATCSTTWHRWHAHTHLKRPRMLNNRLIHPKTQSLQLCRYDSSDSIAGALSVRTQTLLLVMFRIMVLLHSVAGIVRNQRLPFGMKLAPLLLLCLVSVAEAQSCSPTSDCHPKSEDLLTQNLATRTVITSSECGVPVTTQYEDLLGLAVRECSAAIPHPASHMLDRVIGGIGNYTLNVPVATTWYQSFNMIDKAGATPTEQIIVAQFGSQFLIQYIRIIFISPHIDSTASGYDQRPLAMAIEKQVNDTSLWEVLG